MDKAMLTRIGSMVSLPLAGLLVLFFFLPWLEVTCQGNALAEASGLQLALGDVSPTAPAGQGDSDKDPGEDVDARPWFWLGLLIPIGIAIMGLLGATGNMEAGAAGRALIVLGIIGVILMILAATTVDYADAATKDAKMDGGGQGPNNADNPFGQQMQKQMQAQMKDAIKTETTGILWGSLVLYLLVAGCGVVNYVMLSQGGEPAAAAAPEREPYIGPAGPPPSPGPSKQQEPPPPPQA